MTVDSLLSRLRGLPEADSLNRITYIPPETDVFIDPAGNAYECLVVIAAERNGVRLAHLNTDPSFLSPDAATELIDKLLVAAPENSRIVITGAGVPLTREQQAHVQHIINGVSQHVDMPPILDVGRIGNVDTPRRVIIRSVDKLVEVVRYGKSGAPKITIRY